MGNIISQAPQLAQADLKKAKRAKLRAEDALQNNDRYKALNDYGQAHEEVRQAHKKGPLSGKVAEVVADEYLPAIRLADELGEQSKVNAYRRKEKQLREAANDNTKPKKSQQQNNVSGQATAPFAVPASSSSSSKSQSVVVVNSSVQPKCLLSVPKTVNEIKSTRQLAMALVKWSPDHPQRESALALANGVLESFVRTKIKDAKHVQEVSALAFSQEKSIIRHLMQYLTKNLREQALIETEQFSALALVISEAPKTSLQADDLLAIIRVVMERLTRQHLQTDQEQPGSAFLKATHELLAAAGEANLQGVSREEWQDKYYLQLKELSGRIFSPRLKVIVEWVKQALIRIPHDENKLQEVLRRALHFTKGVGSLVSMVTESRPDIELLERSYAEFSQAIKTVEGRSLWYDEMRYLQLLVRTGSYQHFEQLLNLMMIQQSQTSDSRPLAFTWGVVELCDDLVRDHADISLKMKAVKQIVALCQMDCLWRHDDKHLRSYALAYLQVYKETKLFPTIGQAAKEGLEQLLKTPKTGIKYSGKLQSAVKSGKNLPNLAWQVTFKENEKQGHWDLRIAKWVLPTNSRSLLEQAQSSSHVQDLSVSIAQLRQSTLSDENLTEELSVYVPVMLANRPTDLDHAENAELLLDRFRQTTKRVCLLLGDSGSGKSLFMRVLHRALWLAYCPGDPIPVFVNLPGLKNPEVQAIESTLKAMKFNEAQISELKRTQRFIFLLDAYDETYTLQNFYVGNHLEEWQCQVIITCRTSYLTAIENYEHFFIPYHGSNPQYNSFEEWHVTPFGDKQIQLYLEKYLSANQDYLLQQVKEKRYSSQWLNLSAYQKTLSSMSELNALIHNPFLLRITVETLPTLMSDKVDNNITANSLHEAFVNQWFKRQEDKLISQQQHPGQPMRKHYVAFCERLAKKMYDNKQTQVIYDEASVLFDDEEDALLLDDSVEWAPFFSLKPLTLKNGQTESLERCKLRQLTRQGCPLKKIGINTYGFLHQSLADYFVANQIKRQLAHGAGFWRQGAADVSISPVNKGVNLGGS